MKASYKKIAARLLKMASEEFSNHGCNDFDLRKILPNVEDRRALAKAIAKWNGDDLDDLDPEDDHNYEMDWILMSFMADQLDDE